MGSVTGGTLGTSSLCLQQDDVALLFISKPLADEDKPFLHQPGQGCWAENAWAACGPCVGNFYCGRYIMCRYPMCTSAAFTKGIFSFHEGHERCWQRVFRRARHVLVDAQRVWGSTEWVRTCENTKAQKGGHPLRRNHDRVNAVPGPGVRSVQRDLSILCDEVQCVGRMFSFSSANTFLVR